MHLKITIVHKIKTSVFNKGEVMDISNDYMQDVEIMKQLKMSDGFYEVREPYKEDFEELYNQAKDENVTISTAKDFLNSLSKDELSTLQHHTLLVNDIDVNSLSNEGAYNLLLHHYEKYDFDNDGYVSTGEGKGLSFISKNMPNKEKEVLVETLNELDEKDRFLTLMLLQPLTINLTGSSLPVSQNSDGMDYSAIMDRLDRLINPSPPAYTSSELKNSLSLFKELFEKNFDETSEQNEQNRSIKDREAQLLKARISGV